MIGADSTGESLRQVVDRARHERRRRLAVRRALDLVEALLETREQHLVMPALIVVEANSIVPIVSHYGNQARLRAASCRRTTAPVSSLTASRPIQRAAS
jgi:hypothetical protein